MEDVGLVFRNGIWKTTTYPDSHTHRKYFGDTVYNFEKVLLTLDEKLLKIIKALWTIQQCCVLSTFFVWQGNKSKLEARKVNVQLLISFLHTRNERIDFYRRIC